MKGLQLVYLRLEELTPYDGNPRTHSEKQVRGIASSIKSFGMLNPVIISEDNIIIAGHGRYLALKQLGYKKIPCIYAKHLSERQTRAFRIADNKHAEQSGWNIDLLSVELAALEDVDISFDFEALGFDAPEIDMLLHQGNQQTESETLLPGIPEISITQPGDIFYCGPHRVGCGDCRDQTFIRKLFKRSRAAICISDPPYNVPIGGHARGNGKAQFNDFAMACGEMTSEEFTQFLVLSFLSLKKHCKEGSLFYVFTDWRHLKELFAATDDLFSQMLNLCVWNKSNGGMGSLYRSKHELIAVCKHGKGPHINNVQLGKFGRDRTNVWDYPGVSSFGKDRGDALMIHPTVKPVCMLADILLDASRPNDIVVDGFLGSGSTLMAAEKVHRRCFGTEIEPRYVDVILKRYMNETGDEPVHAESGLTFPELAKQRGGES